MPRLVDVYSHTREAEQASNNKKYDMTAFTAPKDHISCYQHYDLPRVAQILLYIVHF